MRTNNYYYQRARGSINHFGIENAYISIARKVIFSIVRLNKWPKNCHFIKKKKFGSNNHFFSLIAIAFPSAPLLWSRSYSAISFIVMILHRVIEPHFVAKTVVWPSPTSFWGGLVAKRVVIQLAFLALLWLVHSAVLKLINTSTLMGEWRGIEDRVVAHEKAKKESENHSS